MAERPKSISLVWPLLSIGIFACQESLTFQDGLESILGSVISPCITGIECTAPRVVTTYSNVLSLKGSETYNNTDQH
jgi:hypothetical protein